MSHVRSAGGSRKTRAEWYATVKPMRDEGLSGLAIARRTGLASTFVYELLSDPDGSKARVRKNRNRKPCPKCGAPTSPETLATGLCVACYRRMVTLPHGTLASYRRSCRCDSCRAANAAHQRTLKGRPAPRHGTESGYRNYGCRCARCKRAHSEHEWLRYPDKKRYGKAAA